MSTAIYALKKIYGITWRLLLVLHFGDISFYLLSDNLEGFAAVFKAFVKLNGAFAFVVSSIFLVSLVNFSIRRITE